eukprot:CFRG8502T1
MLRTFETLNPFQASTESQYDEENQVADSVDNLLGNFLKAFDVLPALAPDGVKKIKGRVAIEQENPNDPSETITKTATVTTTQDSQSIETSITTDKPEVEEGEGDRVGRIGLGTEIAQVTSEVASNVASMLESVVETVSDAAATAATTTADSVMNLSGIPDFAIKKVLQSNLASYAHFRPMNLQVGSNGDEIVLVDVDVTDKLKEKVPVKCFKVGIEKLTVLGVVSSYMYSDPDTPITPVTLRLENIEVHVGLSLQQGIGFKAVTLNPTLEAFLLDNFLFKDLFEAWAMKVIPRYGGGCRINAALFSPKHIEKISEQSEMVINSVFISNFTFSVNKLNGPQCYKVDIKSLDIDVNPSDSRLKSLVLEMNAEAEKEKRVKRDAQVKRVVLGVFVCGLAFIYKILF